MVHIIHSVNVCPSDPAPRNGFSYLGAEPFQNVLADLLDGADSYIDKAQGQCDSSTAAGAVSHQMMTVALTEELRRLAPSRCSSPADNLGVAQLIVYTQVTK